MKEARARHRGGDEDGASPQPGPARPEVTSSLAAYIDLHRHAAVRSEMASRPSVALRVAVAHMICGSPLWSVKPADQRARVAAITESVETCSAEAAFDLRRRAVLDCLGLDAECASVVQDRYGSDLVPIIHRLIELPDHTVMEVLAVVMAETLAPASETIELLGPVLSVDMADHWQPDQAFYDLLRDREVLTVMLGEVGGPAVASANAKETGKVIKGVLADFIDGTNDRVKVEHWLPRWMAFPPGAYTERGGVPTVASANRARWMAGDDEPSDADCGGGTDAVGNVQAPAKLEGAAIADSPPIYDPAGDGTGSVTEETAEPGEERLAA